MRSYEEQKREFSYDVKEVILSIKDNLLNMFEKEVDSVIDKNRDVLIGSDSQLIEMCNQGFLSEFVFSYNNNKKVVLPSKAIRDVIEPLIEKYYDNGFGVDYLVLVRNENSITFGITKVKVVALNGDDDCF